MGRYLVVAHRTLGGRHLFDHLMQLSGDDGSRDFYVVVPRYHPREMIWSDGTTQAIAQELLDHMLEELGSRGLTAAGEVGSSNPVKAISDALDGQDAGSFDGIVLSTLPRGLSRWWRSDVPGRVQKQYPDLPLTHLVATDAVAN